MSDVLGVGSHPRMHAGDGQTDGTLGKSINNISKLSIFTEQCRVLTK